MPHAHLHLMPINTADDLNFTRKKMDISQEELKTVQENLLKILAAN